MGRKSWAETLMRLVYEDEGYDVINDGAPDFILLKNGRIEFVEIKCNSDTLKENQKRAINLLKKHGFTARKEEIRVFKAHGDHAGTHKIEALREGVGNNRVFYKLSSIVERITRGCRTY